MFKEGFYELFGLLEKQKGSRWHIIFQPFNAQANRVVIVSFVIARIFHPMPVLDGHILTLSNDTHDLFILINNCLLPVIVIGYYLIHCSFFIQCIVFINNFIVHPVKYSFLILECIPGISIPTTTFIKRVNKHHTSDCTVFVLV